MLNIFRIFRCSRFASPLVARPVMRALVWIIPGKRAHEGTRKPPNGSDTANPADETDTVDPNPEPEPETEPEETTDPLSGEAPAYHDLKSLLAHLTALDQIAIANNNNRASGTSGYEASVDYVKSQLESWGYEVTLQGFTIDVYDVGDDPILELNRRYELDLSGRLRLDSLQRLRRHNWFNGGR